MTNKEMKEEFLQDINKNTPLTDTTFKYVFGLMFDGKDYDTEWLYKVNESMNTVGKTMFREEFIKWVAEYERTNNESFKNASKWSEKKKFTSTTKNSVIVPKEKFEPVQEITAKELDKMEIPPIKWLVDKILPVGLSMISAPAKYFKSYMMLDLCIQICTGGRFLGFDCEKHGCLYVDLESTKRRPKARINQILGKNAEKPSNLYIITGDQNIGTLEDNFLKNIEHQLEKHPDIKFIVIDVYQLIKSPKSKGSKTSYEKDYEDLRPLKMFADKHDLGMKLVHHNTKMESKDEFNNISGSMGVLGSLDCAWVLSRESRQTNDGTLHITGRDLPNQDYKIRFNKDNYCWEYIGTAEDIEQQRQQQAYEESPITMTIVKLLKLNDGKWQGTSSNLIKNSRLMNCEIYDRPEKVGRFINDNKEFLLWFDNVKVEDGNHRQKIFTTVPTVQNDTTVPTVQTVQDNMQTKLNL